MFTENKIQFTISVSIDDDEIPGVEAMIRLLQDLVENAKNSTLGRRNKHNKPIKTSKKTRIESDSEVSEDNEIIEPVSEKVKNLLDTMTKKVDGVVVRDVIAPNCFTEQKDGSIECKCGSIMEKKNMSKHKKTVKHKEWLAKMSA